MLEQKNKTKSPRPLSTKVSEKSTPISFLTSQYSGHFKLSPFASEFDDPARVKDAINSPKYKLFREHFNMKVFDKKGMPKFSINTSTQPTNMSSYLELKNKPDDRRDSEPTSTIYDKYIDYHSVKHHKVKKSNPNFMEFMKKISKYEGENLKMKFDLEEKDIIISNNMKIIEHLQQKNELLQNERTDLLEKLDKESYIGVELKEFRSLYEDFRKKFPETPFKHFLEKHQRIEDTGIELIEKINYLESNNLAILSDSKQKADEIISLKNYLDRKSFEDIKKHQFMLEQISNIKDNNRSDEYKEPYFNLSNRIGTLYSKWSDIIPVYSGDKVFDDFFENPIKIVDMIERILIVRSPDHLQDSLRKIIVSANLLGKKILGKRFGNSISPEDVYNQISKKMESLNFQIAELNSNLLFFKKNSINEFKLRKNDYKERKFEFKKRIETE